MCAYTYGANPFTVFTNGVERLRVDSAGNLGLGVTPSAWGTIQAVFQVGDGASFFGRTDNTDTYVGTNIYRDSSNDWKYLTSAPAGYYQLSQNTHVWNIAPSGTAGNTITFTQAMTLDASGLLAIGRATAWDSNALLTLEKSGAAAQVINSTTNSVTLINVSNGSASIAYSGTASNHPYAFYSNNTERARITSGGDFCVGTTSVNDARINLVAASGQWGIKCFNAGSGSQDLIAFNVSGGGTSVGAITTNGTNTTYGTSSDQRLKENIISAPDSGDDVDAINVVSYKWKSDGSETKYGLIAQELISVAPDAVQQGDNGEEVERAWGVDYSKLVPMLVKEIQSLRARVVALESK
jgi:hypothetical protein